MKKSNIRKSTRYIILFCVVVFAIMSLYSTMRKGKTEMHVNHEHRGKEWSDTISNASSQVEALVPMEKEIERFMQRWNLRGMSLAVSRDGRLLYTKGFGMADVEAGEPMEANSRMRIASASKLLTAAAIMKLVEQGKVGMDTRVFGDSGVLKRRDFTQAIADKRMFQITVGQLLRHQGGFTLGAGDPMFNTVEIMKAKKLDKAPDNDELIKIVGQRRLGFQPGAGRRYSNFGYMLLSKVIEKVSGKTYWDFVKDELLTPAGCTGIVPATNYYEDRHPGEVKYYSPDAERVADFSCPSRMVDRCYGGANINGLMGAGGWVSSAADLCRFVAAIDGNPNFPDVLKKESVVAMTVADTEDNGKQCLGWTDSDPRGKWSRSGTLSSAHALIEHFPDGECWVITMNTGVWTGFRFNRDMSRLVERLRGKYSPLFPKKNLFSNS